jgi:NTE family protein
MVDVVAPVTPLADGKPRGPLPGIGLAVSGGGYRAMLFHLGAFLRLYEVGLLKEIDRISSVSGGSITSAMVALKWKKIQSRDDFFQEVVKPIRRLAYVPIDIPCILAGLVSPWTVSHFVALAYRWFLFGNATLQDLPSKPEFVINATNVETGVLWRFGRATMGDYIVGAVSRPTLPLASAVAASSAFPPFLSPYVLAVDPADFPKRKKPPAPKLQSDITLTDGGVYDNLGLERIWKSFQNVLVSDAGSPLRHQPSPSAFWVTHSMRVTGVIYNQVATLRRRQLIASYKAKVGDPLRRRGTYWGIHSNVDHYHLKDPLKAPFERTSKLAHIRTALWCLSTDTQERLINWGYAICDTAIRRHFPQKNMPPPAFPYDRGI